MNTVLVSCCATHVSCFLVVINVVDVPGQPEVCNLHHIVFCHQDIPGSQVPVNALRRARGS